MPSSSAVTHPCASWQHTKLSERAVFTVPSFIKKPSRERTTCSFKNFGNHTKIDQSFQSSILCSGKWKICGVYVRTAHDTLIRLFSSYQTLALCLDWETNTSRWETPRLRISCQSSRRCSLSQPESPFLAPSLPSLFDFPFDQSQRVSWNVVQSELTLAVWQRRIFLGFSVKKDDKEKRKLSARNYPSNDPIKHFFLLRWFSLFFSCTNDSNVSKRVQPGGAK